MQVDERLGMRQRGEQGWETVVVVVVVEVVAVVEVAAVVELVAAMVVAGVVTGARRWLLAGRSDRVQRDSGRGRPVAWRD